MDSDPNNDPEFVRLFTITDSDEDSDSDEENLISPWRMSLQPTENPYDRSARVQQANRELFSQPFAKKKLKSKVQFDLIPQSINGEETATHVGGEGESVNMENNNSNLQTRFQRRDTTRVILVPRRFSSLQYNNHNNINNKQLNPAQRPNQNQYNVPRLSRQPNTREDQQQTFDQNRQKEEKQSSEQVLQQSQPQSQTPKSQSSEERLRLSSKQSNPESRPRSSMKSKNPCNDQTQ